QHPIGLDAFQSAVGMPLNAQPSLTKIVWLQRENAELAGATHFLSVPEWAVVSLGGSPVSELSLASRTGLLDLGEAVPFSGAVELLGRNLLSEIVIAGTPTGQARHEALPAGAGGPALAVVGPAHQAAAPAAGAGRPDGAARS